MNPMMIFQQFMQNPMALLAKRFNLPQGLNNPNDIIQHLVKTGQVSQSQVDNAMQMLNSFKGMRRP